MSTVVMAPEIASAIPPDMIAQANDWPTRAEGMIVTDDVTNEAAAEMLLGIKDLGKEVNATFDPIKKKSHEAWKLICDEQYRHLAPLLQAEKILKSVIGNYAMEQHRKLEEARRIAAAEHVRLEAIARRDAEERLEREIEAAEQVGAAPEEILAMIAAPLEIAPIYVAPIARKVDQPKGISVPMRLEARIDNKLLLLRHLVAHPQFLNIIEVDQGALNKIAAALGAAAAWPGVTLIQVPVVRAGGRR